MPWPICLTQSSPTNRKKAVYFVGIDGGGTTTVVAVGNAEGKEIDRFELGPSNYHVIGLDQLKILFAKVLDHLRNRHRISAESIQSIAFCGAGIDATEDQIVVRRAIIEAGFVHQVTVLNDGVGAVAGANGCAEGAVLISGTGSIALGVKKGVCYRVGGWGHIIDDEGSGYWIAKEGLAAVFKAYDGRGRQTKLTELILNHFGLTQVEELIGFIYSDQTQKQHIADLAPYVLESAVDDPVCEAIVKQSAQSLLAMGLTLMQQMGVSKLVIKLSGSVLLKSDAVRRQLMGFTEASDSPLRFETPDQDAASGALLLAYNK